VPIVDGVVDGEDEGIILNISTGTDVGNKDDVGNVVGVTVGTLLVGVII
jgi:hypothetical protein